MPKLYFKHEIKPKELWIGVQRGAGSKDENKGVWTARLFLKGYKNARYKSTRIKYDNGNPDNFEKAMDAALEIYGTYFNAAEAGLDDGTPNYAFKISDDYLKEAYGFKEANEAFLESYPDLDPPHDVKGGRGYWDDKKYKNSEQLIRTYVQPFWRTLRGKAGRDEAEINLITPQQLDGFRDFVLQKNPTLSPSSVLKAITEIRHIYRYAYRQGIVSSIPAPERPKRNLDKRVRMELTLDVYEQMIQYTRDRYREGGITRLNYMQDGELKEVDVDTYRDYAYLFHLWILVLANTGIRPPTGGVEHTQMRWEHYKPTEHGAVLERPDEKNHTYTAIVMPRAMKYFDALKKFQEDRNITSEYIFAHPKEGHIGRGQWSKGDPIKSFQAQWRTMLNNLGFSVPKGTPQSKRLTPSSLRSFFITHRLKEGNVNLERLALATGTSIDEIMKHYYRFSTQAEYEKLTQGGFKDEKPTKPSYDENGYYVGSKED